jgi:hypothetical protein
MVIYIFWVIGESWFNKVGMGELTQLRKAGVITISKYNPVFPVAFTDAGRE